MTGFSFPPPPPPPPKAASSQQPETLQTSSRGGRDGRGGRGNPRGRGGQQQRGGRQQSNPNYVPQNFSQNGNMNGTCYGGSQQQSYSAPGSFQQNFPIPPGAFVNPAFNPPQAYAQSSPVSQYGQPQQYGQQYGQQYQQQQNVYQSPEFSPSGQKRSAQQAFGHSHKPPLKKPPSAPKVPAAPAVPSFGAPIPIASKPSTTGPPSQPATKKAADKKRVNLFGLTAEGTVAEPTAAGSENEEEDVDEEAAFATNVSTEPMQVEYNGETYNLNSPAELAAWIAERKRNFPTRQRVEEKKVEVRTRMEERKRIEEETRAARLADPGSALPNVRGSKAERGGKKDRNMDRQKQRGSKGRENAAAVSTEEFSIARTAESSTAQLQEPTLEELKKQLEIQTEKMEEIKRTLAENEAKAGAGGRPPNEANATNAEITTLDETASEPVQIPTADLKPALPTDEASTTKAISTTALDVFAAAIDTSPELALNPTTTFETTTTTTNTTKATASDSDSESSVSSSDSSSDSSSSDDDEAPEETSSRPHDPPRVPASNPNRPICRAFATHGVCKFGPKCRHKHESSALTQLAASKNNNSSNTKPSRKDNNERRRTTSLFRKMVEQEREDEGRLVLQAIRYLGGVGFFSRR